MFLPRHQAIAIRDFFEDSLKAVAPIVTRLSVRPRVSGAGPGGWYLEVGIARKAKGPEKDSLDLLVATGLGPGPIRTPGPLTVRIVVTGPMRLLGGDYDWTGDQEPVRGGHRVRSAGSPWGTLGCLVRLRRDGVLDPTHPFLLTCWHVLQGTDLEWPVDSASGFSKALGKRYWSMVDSRFDVAIGLIEDPEVEIGTGFAWSRIGDCPATPAPPPADEDTVVVCGHVSQATGELQSTSATVWVDLGDEDPMHKFTNQIQTDSICQAGDSGAVLFLDAGTVPIGMAFANNVADPEAEGVQPGTFYNNLADLFGRAFTDSNRLGDRSFQLDSIVVG